MKLKIPIFLKYILALIAVIFIAIFFTGNNLVATIVIATAFPYCFNKMFREMGIEHKYATYTSLGWFMSSGLAPIFMIIERSYSTTFDGAPPISSNISLYVLLPISAILFFLGTNFFKPNKLRWLKIFFLVSIETFLSFCILIFYGLMYCVGGCL